jgi:hypothetical protein
MTQNNSLEFVTRYCKQGPHSECHGSWTGLGFTMNCNCICHRKKMGKPEVVGPQDSPLRLNSSSKEADHRKISQRKAVQNKTQTSNGW